MTSDGQGAPSRADGALRFLLIATIAFLTLVDLFATQVIIPGLTQRYGVSPATMGAAVSACTFGMAAASLAVALLSDRIDRRLGIIPALSELLAGMALVAVGTFLAQALATGFVSRAAMGDRAAASGLYLASYFSGGLVGAVVLGQVYTRAGWNAMLLAVAVALCLAGILARSFVLPTMTDAALRKTSAGT